ncbi:cyclin-dependent kinase F-1 [Iris pallida]|uniref:Cyclin-dependent kinase F-1 n=1 Tax=Iris pallida TaxID=29817 RepID=A0AAX6E5S8_IRIPA|nr:cyclin-dependent kinase F-1 [Iris pallida]
MDPAPVPAPAPKTRSWSIYGRAEITDRYEVLDRVGSGTYSDVYRARRRSDGLPVALKEIHDYQSSFREIEALQSLRHAPNVVALVEYFWSDDEDAVLVLEFMETDVASVVREGRRRDGGIGVGEVKAWMVQILKGVEDCHRSSVVHRDLKPSNLLVSADGVVKIADFGQARILQDTRYLSMDNSPPDQVSENEAWMPQQPTDVHKTSKSYQEGQDLAESSKSFQHGPDLPQNQNDQEPKVINEEAYLQEVGVLKAKYPDYGTDREISLQDGEASCLATCSTGDIEEDPFIGSTYSYDAAGGGENDESGALTSCVGTRWYRAPELLYGATNYGQEVDLWSLGCIFAELLGLKPLFSGTSDLDQLAKIITVLGDMNEETWRGCSKLPDYSKISFNKVDNPVGVEACLPNRSPAEVNLVRKLLCYDPMNRATAKELLNDRYFGEEPLPVPVNELTVPSRTDGHDESSEEEWGGHRGMGSDSDSEEFGRMDVVTTEKGFSLKFS